jgi:hypothetical protein
MDDFVFLILLEQQKNGFEKESIRGTVVEIMQLLDEIIGQVNPFAESYTRMPP